MDALTTTFVVTVGISLLFAALRVVALTVESLINLWRKYRAYSRAN